MDRRTRVVAQAGTGQRLPGVGHGSRLRGETGPAAWPSSWATTRWSRPSPIAANPGTTTPFATASATRSNASSVGSSASARIATRYDKLDVIFLSLIYLALIYDALQSM